MTAHIVTIDDATLDKMIDWWKYAYTWNREPVGYKIENASTNPAVKRIDRNGLEVTLSADFFWNHELYIMPQVILSPSGVPTYGSDRIGTGLDLTGASGDVMVWCNNAQYKSWYESDSDTLFKLFAPYDSNYRGFDYHPHCYAGGGTKHDHFFLGAFEAGLKDDNGIIKLTSASGVQPITGGEMKYLSFTSGGVTAFTVGETLTNAVTGATGIVVSYHLTSGSWAGGDAAGIVYLRQTTGTSGAGQLNGSLAGTDCATASGASTALAFTIDDALLFASNKGAGWTIEDIYCRSLMQDLFYTQHGTRNSQTAIGLGVVNLTSGSGFAGKLTGADSINDRVDAFGTGMGNGTNGQTPIRWNNLENWLGGNVLEFTAGVNFYNSGGTDGDGNPYTAGSFRVTKQDGTGTIAGTLPAGSYETGVGTVPMVDAYYSKIMTDPLGALLNIPMVAGDVNSGDDKGFCDYWYYPRSNPSIVLSGGRWNYGLTAGVGYRASFYAPSSSDRDTGARLKYIPQA